MLSVIVVVSVFVVCVQQSSVQWCMFEVLTFTLARAVRAPNSDTSDLNFFLSFSVQFCIYNYILFINYLYLFTVLLGGGGASILKLPRLTLIRCNLSNPHPPHLKRLNSPQLVCCVLQMSWRFLFLNKVEKKKIKIALRSISIATRITLTW